MSVTCAEVKFYFNSQCTGGAAMKRSLGGIAKCRILRELDRVLAERIASQAAKMTTDRFDK